MKPENMGVRSAIATQARPYAQYTVEAVSEWQPPLFVPPLFAIVGRERQVLARIYDGRKDPFDVI
jgi:hypothetical protein